MNDVEDGRSSFAVLLFGGFYHNFRDLDSYFSTQCSANRSLKDGRIKPKGKETWGLCVFLGVSYKMVSELI